MNSSAIVALLVASQLAILAILSFVLHKVRRVHLATYPLITHAESTRTETHALFAQFQSLLALERKLALPEALPAMRGWAGSPDFLLVVANHVLGRRPETVVECSSGVSTIVLARCMQINGSGRVYSLENDAVYAERTRKLLASYQLEDWATVIDAPLEVGNGNRPWYSLHNLPSSLPPIQLLVVDGPPAGTAPLAREPALPKLFDSMAKHATIIMDDTNRPDEQEIIKHWLTAFPGLTTSAMPCEKGCTMIEIQRENRPSQSENSFSI